jgi:DNA-binding HxlR family transcriptional regulator
MVVRPLPGHRELVAAVDVRVVLERQFVDIHRELQGGDAAEQRVEQAMLTLTLRQLGEDGLITRTAYAEVPPRVAYSLTPLGESLLGAATSLIQWVSTHHSEIREYRALAKSG